MGGVGGRGSERDSRQRVKFNLKGEVIFFCAAFRFFHVGVAQLIKEEAAL